MTGQVYLTAIALGLVCTTAAAWLLATRVASSTLAAVMGILALSLSKAFTDFSTSGLENPLSHVLLTAFIAAYWPSQSGRSRIGLLALFTSLLMLNRFDAGLLVWPAFIWAVVAAPRRAPALRQAALGLLPFAAWEVFSVVYYGFSFPNTAYAKLGTGLTATDLAPLGVQYLQDSWTRDPLTLTAIGIAMFSPLSQRNRAGWPFAVGLGLFLAYVTRIGGDFMSGRFLTAPLVVAIALIVREDAIGFFGFAAGPKLHIVDVLGLADPLMARLPVEPGWRVGYYYRNTPDGYLETLASGMPQIRNPAIAAYYEYLRLMTRGPLFSRRRLRAVLEMNLGRFGYLLDPVRRGFTVVRAADVASPIAGGTQGGTPRTTPFERGIDIEFDGLIQVRRLEVSIDGGPALSVVLFGQGRRLTEQTIEA